MESDFFIKQANALITAKSCCKELKEAAESYLKAVGGDKEKEALKNLIKEAELDVTSVDGLLDFLNSEHAVKIFGEQGVSNMLSHAKDLKASGAKYCDCPACAAAAAIFEKHDAK